MEQLIKAPIDNKNILEDFTEVFHDGYYIEDTERDCKIVRQSFYVCGIPFELSYRFGTNMFRIESLRKANETLSIRKIQNDLESLKTETIHVECVENLWSDGFYSIVAQFYFK